MPNRLARALAGLMKWRAGVCGVGDTTGAFLPVKRCLSRVVAGS